MTAADLEILSIKENAATENGKVVTNEERQRKGKEDSVILK